MNCRGIQFYEVMAFEVIFQSNFFPRRVSETITDN